MSNAFSAIQDFLALRRIALVGASHDPKDFSRAVMRAFLARGYDVIPVNRRPGLIEARETYPNVAAIPEPVEGVLVMVPPAEAEAVVTAAIDAGVRKVWLHRGAGGGASSAGALRVCAARGVTVVDGECPMMFLAESGGVHALHGAMRRLGGDYPHGGVRPPSRALIVTLMVLEAVIGVAAAVGGGILVADPTGAGLGTEVAMLSGSPFSDFLVPGIVLLAVIGCGHLAAAVVTAAGGRTTALLAAMLGAFLVLWILAQWLWLTPTMFLQPVCVALGASEVALGLLLVRRAKPPLTARRLQPT